MRASLREWLAPGAAAAIAALLLLVAPPLGAGGLLEPDDTKIALAARAAGGADGAPLDRVAARLVAASFHLFGVHTWSARLPLALAILLAVALTYAALARVVDRRAAVYGAAILATTPIAVLQARSLAGGALGMLACAVLVFGVATTVAPGRQGLRGLVGGLVVAMAGASGVVAIAVASRGAHPAWPQRFDMYAAHIVLGLAPWSFLLPALARHLVVSPRGESGERESRFRAALLVLAVLAFVLPTCLPESGAVFAGAPIVAALAAMALRELDRRALGSWELLASLAVALVVAHDVLNERGALLAGSSLAPMAYPETLAPRVRLVGGMALALFFAPLAWGSLRRRVESLGAAVVAGAVAFALLLGVGLRSAVASELSPAGAFEAYASLKSAGEPLGVLGVSSSAADLYGPPEARFRDPASASSWLTSAPAGGRRFVVVAPGELAALNHRVRATTHENAAVVGPPSTTAVLVASSRVGGDHAEGPLDGVVRHDPPTLAHPIDARLGDSLDVVGYEILDATGRPLRALRAGKTQKLRVVYRVLGPVEPSWTAFVHVDGHGRRHNGDHALVAVPGGLRYTPDLWLPGDVIVDESDLTLEPNFANGTYTLYLGFFSGDRRLPVTRGKSDGDNRLIAGQLRVE